MKGFIILSVFFIGITFAEVPWTSDPATNDKHYTQHKESVSAARKGVSERLQQLGVSNSYISQSASDGSGAGGGHNLAPSDGLCNVPCESSQVATNDAESFAAIGGDVGVGYVGFPSGDSSSSRFSVQSDYSQRAMSPIVLPSVGSNSRSSYAAHSERVSQQQALPIVLPVSGGSERYSSHSQHMSESKAVPVPIVYPSGGSERYSSRSERISERKAAPMPIIYHPPSGSERYSSHSERVSESNTAPVLPVYPIGESERYSQHSERQSETKSSPMYVPVYPSGGSERYSSNLEHYSQVKATPIVPVYQPPRGSERYSSHSEHVQETNEAPVYPVYPVAGGSSRYSSRQESMRQTASAPQPIILPQPQSSSSRYSNEESHVSSMSQPQYVPIVPSGGSASRYSAQNEYSHTGRVGGGYVPVYAQTTGQDHSSLLNTGNGAYVSRYGNYPQGGIAGGSRLPSRGGSSIFDNHASAGLSSYMTESERLARLQAQGVQGTGAYAGSSTVDADFSQTDNTLGLGVDGSTGAGGAGGGFVRTKSWENNSKWASGTQYDESGKPKTYSSLSTAESEQHNINGKSTGYKAATTTLEDDGRVSTYSIHTP